MHIHTQNIIAEHILKDFAKYKVTTMEGIGLLESVKLSLFNKSIRSVEK